jgi:hypothetical protein
MNHVLRRLNMRLQGGKVLFFFDNWLAGSLSGPKSPIFRHTSQFFLTIALLWPAKNRFVWQKMDPFLAQTRPANQLLFLINAQHARGKPARRGAIRDRRFR